MDIKGKKIGLGLATGILLLVIVLSAVVVLIAPLAALIVLVNMAYNKGSIDFSPKQAPRSPKVKREPFEKLKI